MDSIWLSIIIPVYNPPMDLFEKCIKSALKITIPMEIILIDDGSKDSIHEFCCSMQSNNIHCFSQQNRGVSAARNLGIEKARGKYIFFLDADDEISSEWCEFINKQYKQITGDWVLFDVIGRFPKDDTFLAREVFKQDLKKISTKQVSMIMTQSAALNECWGKLISREFVANNHICFPKGISWLLCFKTI
ncbi:MAG: glycosyltransferase [Alistipes sp.]|nr:glycosyltransferase [Alistipes sp.]